MKFDLITFLKDVGEEIKGTLEPILSRVDKLESDVDKVVNSVKSIKEYDDSKLSEKIDAIKEYDDSKLNEKIDKGLESIEPYDDSKLNEKIDAIEEYDDSQLKEDMEVKFGKVLDRIKDYDDSELVGAVNRLKESLTHFTKKHDERIKQLESIKGYDDSELSKRIDAVQKLFEEKTTAITEKFNETIKVEAPTPKQHIPGDSEHEKGSWIVWNNSVYINLIDKNASTPCEKNHAYLCIIKSAPMPEHMGVFVEDEKYLLNQMVMKENSTWIRTLSKEDGVPGESDAWKLMAKQGGRGRKGEKGDVGDTKVVETDTTKILQDLHDEVSLLKSKTKGFENVSKK